MDGNRELILMVVKSGIHRGLQRRGNTQIDSDISIEKTGAMEVTVRAGTFVDVNGEEFTLTSDTPISLSAGTDNFVALIHNPGTGETRVWHATDPDAEPPAGFKLLQTLVGWRWFVIPAGTTDIADVPLHTFTWIDNDVEQRYKKVSDPETLRVVDKLKFYGKGEESGKEYEFNEMEHFAQRKGQGGVFFMCPKCGAVTRGRPCKECGNRDTVKVKDCR